MSAPLNLTPEQLHQLATALERLTEITKDTDVSFTSHGELSAEIGDSNLQVWHNGEQYVVKDCNGR
jgi:hypothetical protein